MLRAALATVTLSLLLPGTAAAAPDPGCLASHEDPGLQQLAARGYVQDFGVSYTEAYRRLELQDRAVEVADRITGALGPRYAGAWFDNSDGGRFKVGYTAGADLEPARRIVAECRLEASVVFLELEWSWTELLAAQDALIHRLEPLGLGARWASGLTVSAQRWVIRVQVAVEGLAAEDSAAIDAAIAATPVPIERVNVDRLDLAIEPAIGIWSPTPLELLDAQGQAVLRGSFGCALRPRAGHLRLLIVHRHAVGRAHRLLNELGLRAAVRVTSRRYRHSAMAAILGTARSRMGRHNAHLQNRRGRLSCPRVVRARRPGEQRRAAALVRRYGRDRVLVPRR